MGGGNDNQGRDGNGKLILDQINHRIKAADLCGEIGRAGRRRKGHAGRCADDRGSGGSRSAHGLKDRKESDEEQHCEAGGGRDHHDQNLTDEIAADEHEVRCAQHAEGFHGDVNQGLGGADAVHIGSKAAGRHNQKADAGALLGGNGFERIEDVKEHES